MNVTHHADDVTLMAFAAGTLCEALSAVTSCHVEWCSLCRTKVRQMRRIGAALLEVLDPEPVSGRSAFFFTARMNNELNVRDFPVRARRCRQADQELPRPLSHVLQASSINLQWKWLAPGVKYVPLSLSNGSLGTLRLLHIASGRRMPEHGHCGTELTLVLRGSYSDETGCYGRGDLAEMDEQIDHQPVIASDQPCICLVGWEASARLKTLSGKIVQRLTGM